MWLSGCEVEAEVEVEAEAEAALEPGDQCAIPPDPTIGNGKCNDKPRTDPAVLGFDCFEEGVAFPSATSVLSAATKCAAWLIKTKKIKMDADFSKRACGECPVGSTGCQVAPPWKDYDGYVVNYNWVTEVDSDEDGENEYHCGKCQEDPALKIEIYFRCTRCVADDC